MKSYKECRLRHTHGYIYIMRNTLNNKCYVGQSTNPELRWRKHKEESLRNTHSHLYRAIRKYGWDAFERKILEECNVSEMNDREKYWISYYNSYECGYNSTRGGEGGDTLSKLSASRKLEISQKISSRLRSNNGNKGQYVGKLNPMYGKHLSEEHKAKMSAKLKGVPKPSSHGKNVSKATKGVPKTYCHPNKYLYLVDTRSGDTKRLKARAIKDILGLSNYKELKSIVDSASIVQGYDIREKM